MKGDTHHRTGAPGTGTDAVVTSLLAARDGARLVAVSELLRDEDAADLTPARAYAVQDCLGDRYVERGQRQVGWKVGMTNDARRAAMGLSEPTRGRLFEGMLQTRSSVIASSPHPRLLEPEVVMRVREPLPTRPSRDDVAAATSVLAGIEVVSSRLRGWPDVPFWCAVADNSAAEAVIIGTESRELRADEIRDITVTLSGPSGEVHGDGSAILGHPLEAVLWLQAHLRAAGDGLRPGDLVFTGGMTTALPAVPGSFEAVYSHGLGSLDVEVAG